MSARVLVVDASMVAREILSRSLGRVPGIRVVGSAASVQSCLTSIKELDPEVLVLDPQLPKVDGVEFLRRLVDRCGVEIVAVTADASIRRAVLDAGASRVVMKPSAHLVGEQAERMLLEVSMAVLSAGRGERGRLIRPDQRLLPAARTVIAVGASTGGTDAIRAVLTGLPAGLPPIVVVQHMPPGFTATFASRLDEDLPKLRVREAFDGARLHDGEVWIAPGGRHMGVDGRPGALELRVQAGAKVSGHAPSVDVLFGSVASTLGAHSLGLLLTGMGRDGAAGLMRLKQAGSPTYAQDEESSVVWGMPRVAWEMGAARALVDLESASKILRCFRPRMAA